MLRLLGRADRGAHMADGPDRGGRLRVGSFSWSSQPCILIGFKMSASFSWASRSIQDVSPIRPINCVR